MICIRTSTMVYVTFDFYHTPVASRVLKHILQILLQSVFPLLKGEGIGIKFHPLIQMEMSGY